ncbi:MAG: ComEC/Rec2 family competence protein [bacterium]|nr:ComEC/Rec2 family competence protein [bacterium]
MSSISKTKILKYSVFSFIFASALVWTSVFKIEARGGLLAVHFFDVGQGDAIFIESPNGYQVLVDGGPDNSVLSKLAGVMPFWDRSIDLVILTHPHADHVDGLLEVLRRYEIGAVIESGVNHSIPEYGEWHAFLEEKGVPVTIAEGGQVVKFSDGVSLNILTPFKSFVGESPKNIHDSMVIFRLTYASSTALFMGDAEKSLERRLISLGDDIKAEVLKAGHHGSKTSSFEEFLRAVSPEVVVISVGAKNRYGHPYQEVLDRFHKLGIKIFRTDMDGDVVFVSDGVQFLLDKEPQ